MNSFVSGDWDSAIGHFNDVMAMTNGKDGPTKQILSKMEAHQNKVPEGWLGYRELQ